MFYELWAHKMRLRAEITILVLGWIESVCFRLQDLQTQSEGVYRDGKPFLEQGDYNAICRELKDKLLSAELEIRLALVYGKSSQEVTLFNTLQKELLAVTLMLWDAKKETWDSTEDKVMSIFARVIDPMRNQFKEILLKKASSRIFLSNV